MLYRFKSDSKLLKNQNIVEILRKNKDIVLNYKFHSRFFHSNIKANKTKLVLMNGLLYVICI